MYDHGQLYIQTCPSVCGPMVVFLIKCNLRNCTSLCPQPSTSTVEDLSLPSGCSVMGYSGIRDHSTATSLWLTADKASPSSRLATDVARMSTMESVSVIFNNAQHSRAACSTAMARSGAAAAERSDVPVTLALSLNPSSRKGNNWVWCLYRRVAAWRHNVK